MKYQISVANIQAVQLEGGFFEGWPNPPQAEAQLRILQGSSCVVLPVGQRGKVVGFITAISDGVSCAYVPHLEMLRQFRGNGIGTELVRRMLEQLADLYMVDLCCDDNVVSFYQTLGFHQCNAMVLRNHTRQSCA